MTYGRAGSSPAFGTKSWEMPGLIQTTRQTIFRFIEIKGWTVWSYCPETHVVLDDQGVSYL